MWSCPPPSQKFTQGLITDVSNFWTLSVSDKINVYHDYRANLLYNLNSVKSRWSIVISWHLVSMTLSGNERLSVALVSVVLRPWLLLLRINSPMPNRNSSNAMATVTPTMMAVLSLSVRHAQRILSVTVSQTVAKNNRIRYVHSLKRCHTYHAA